MAPKKRTRRTDDEVRDDFQAVTEALKGWKVESADGARRYEFVEYRLKGKFVDWKKI